MSCDVSEATEGLENKAEPHLPALVKQRKCCRMSCDVDEATEGLENEL